MMEPVTHHQIVKTRDRPLMRRQPAQTNLSSDLPRANGADMHGDTDYRFVSSADRESRSVPGHQHNSVCVSSRRRVM